MEFAQAVQVLCDGGVEFVIVGGVAGVFHGSTRVTYDLDICYSRTSENLKRLAAALSPFHPRPRGFAPDLPFVWDATTLSKSTILTLQTDFGEVDLLAEITGIGSFAEVRDHSIAVDAFDRRVLTIDLPTLIRAKRAAGREKDHAALPELESLLEADAGE